MSAEEDNTPEFQLESLEDGIDAEEVFRRHEAVIRALIGKGYTCISIFETPDSERLFRKYNRAVIAERFLNPLMAENPNFRNPNTGRLDRPEPTLESMSDLKMRFAITSSAGRIPTFYFACTLPPLAARLSETVFQEEGVFSIVTESNDLDTTPMEPTGP